MVRPMEPACGSTHASLTGPVPFPRPSFGLCIPRGRNVRQRIERDHEPTQHSAWQDPGHSERFGLLVVCDLRLAHLDAGGQLLSSRVWELANAAVLVDWCNDRHDAVNERAAPWTGTFTTGTTAKNQGWPMKPPSNMKALFVDIGGVLLSDGWDHIARESAAAAFNLDWAEIEERHHLAFAQSLLDELLLGHPGANRQAAGQFHFQPHHEAQEEHMLHPGAIPQRPLQIGELITRRGFCVTSSHFMRKSRLPSEIWASGLPTRCSSCFSWWGPRSLQPGSSALFLPRCSHWDLRPCSRLRRGSCRVRPTIAAWSRRVPFGACFRCWLESLGRTQRPQTRDGGRSAGSSSPASRVVWGCGSAQPCKHPFSLASPSADCLPHGWRVTHREIRPRRQNACPGGPGRSAEQAPVLRDT